MGIGAPLGIDLVHVLVVDRKLDEELGRIEYIQRVAVAVIQDVHLQRAVTGRFQALLVTVVGAGSLLFCWISAAV